MAEKVGERWNTLFPDRPELRFDLEGDLWRDFRGHRLSVDAFSKGEQIAARLGDLGNAHGRHGENRLDFEK